MTTKPFAMIFPGQGSQSVGMLSELAKTCPKVMSTFDIASSLLHYDLWALCQQGPAEKLDQTVFTQPALLTADIAVWYCWKKLHGPMPHMVAGHSLGEYAALVAAQVLRFEDAVQLVSERGRLMQEAVAPGQGAMAAIVGLEDQMVTDICERVSHDGLVSPANYNAIGQVVIAGEKSAVLKAMQLAEASGATMTKVIPVSVPSHCRLMQPAAERLAQQLKLVTMAEPMIPVIQNREARAYRLKNDILDALIKQLIDPVRWVTTIQAMLSQGVRHLVECGPGRVLAGLNKHISRDIQTHHLQSETEVAQVIHLIHSV